MKLPDALILLLYYIFVIGLIILIMVYVFDGPFLCNSYPPQN